MNRLVNSVGIIFICVPHSRGDEPQKSDGIWKQKTRSPQPWG